MVSSAGLRRERGSAISPRGKVAYTVLRAAGTGGGCGEGPVNVSVVWGEDV